MLSNTLFLHIPGLSCLWWLLLAMLIPLLLGLLLGYWLWQKYKGQAAEMERERDTFHDRANDLERNNAELRYKNDELQKDNNALRASLNSVEADLAVMRTKYEHLQREGKQTGEGTESIAQRGLGVAPVGGTEGEGVIDYTGLFVPDDLQIIEGIGSKVEQVLKQAGIGSWSELAAQSPEDLRGILAAAGPAYKMMDPEPWPQQAKLASEGRWEELVEYQKLLDVGQDQKVGFETPSKIENQVAEMMGFSGSSPDDLKIIEGIGPKVEELLKNNGIGNWQELAFTNAGEIKDLLGKAGANYRLADPTSWPQQAQLAADGKWKELKEFQDFLKGGKKPE